MTTIQGLKDKIAGHKQMMNRYNTLAIIEENALEAAEEQLHDIIVGIKNGTIYADDLEAMASIK